MRVAALLAAAALALGGCEGNLPPELHGDGVTDTTPSDTSAWDTWHDPWTDTTTDTSGTPCDPPCTGYGWECCDGVCVDVFADMENCGECGNACDPERTDRCVGGSCSCRGYAECSFMQHCCPGTGCRTLSSDPANCNACGHACGEGFTCNSGLCLCAGDACDPGRGCCAGSCMDLTSDPSNCGACGNICTASAPDCVDGACTCEGDPPCSMCGFLACTSLTPPGPYDECLICCHSRGCVPMSDSDCGVCGSDCPAGTRCEPVMGMFTCGFQCLTPGADASTDAEAGG